MDRRELLTISAVAVPALLDAQVGVATDWKPLLFDAHQNATVIALTDLIIPATDTPGAKAANVNRYMDLLLNDGREADRVSFLEGLGWLDQSARQEHQAPFVKLTPSNQIALLTKLDQGVNGMEEGTRFFRTAKAMTARIFYATKLGFDELNKGGRVPSSYLAVCTPN